MGKKVKAKEVFHIFSNVMKSEFGHAVIDMAKEIVEQCGLAILGRVLTSAVNKNDHFTDEDKATKSTKLNEAIAGFDHINKKTAEEFAVEIADILFGDMDYEDDDVAAIKTKIEEIKYDIAQIIHGNALYLVELASDLTDLKESTETAADVAHSYLDNDKKEDAVTAAAPKPEIYESAKKNEEILSPVVEKEILDSSKPTEIQEENLLGTNESEILTPESSTTRNSTPEQIAVIASSNNYIDHEVLLEDVTFDKAEDPLTSSVTDLSLLGTDNTV